MQLRLRLATACAIGALVISGCGYGTTVALSALALSSGGGSSQQSKTTYTVSAASGATTKSSGTVDPADPTAPGTDTPAQSSVACVSIIMQTFNGTFTDSGCGEVTMTADALLSSVHVSGTLASRVTDAKGVDLGESKITIDLSFTGTGDPAPLLERSFDFTVPDPAKPGTSATLSARAGLHRSGVGSGTVTSQRFGPVQGPVTKTDLYRDVVITGAAKTCLDAAEACKPQ